MLISCAMRGGPPPCLQAYAKLFASRDTQPLAFFMAEIDLLQRVQQASFHYGLHPWARPYMRQIGLKSGCSDCTDHIWHVKHAYRKETVILGAQTVQLTELQRVGEWLGSLSTLPTSRLLYMPQPTMDDTVLRADVDITPSYRKDRSNSSAGMTSVTYPHVTAYICRRAHYGVAGVIGFMPYFGDS